MMRVFSPAVLLLCPLLASAELAVTVSPIKVTGDESGPWTSDPAVIHDYNVIQQQEIARQQWYDSLPPNQQAAYHSILPFEFNLTQFSDSLGSGDYSAAGRSAESLAAESLLNALTLWMFKGPVDSPMPNRSQNSSWQELLPEAQQRLNAIKAEFGDVEAYNMSNARITWGQHRVNSVRQVRCHGKDGRRREATRE